MSFDVLPEELLSKVAKHCAAAQYFEDLFEGRIHPRLQRSIACEDHGVEALASVNSQLRRICPPILFMRVVIQRTNNGMSRLSHNLNIFARLTSQRPHIAEHIVSIDVNDRSGIFTPFLALPDALRLTACLPFLPRITTVPEMAVDEGIVRAINDRPALHSVVMRNFPVLPGCDAASCGSDFLRKVTVARTSLGSIFFDEGDTSNIPDFFLPYLNMGLKFSDLGIFTNSRDFQNLYRVSLSALRILHVVAEPGSSDPPSPSFPVELVRAVNSAPLLGKIQFTCLSSSAPPTKPPSLDHTRDGFPLLSRFLPLPVTGEDENNLTLVWYAIERSSSPSDSGTLGYWERHWEIRSVFMRSSMSVTDIAKLNQLGKTPAAQSIVELALTYEAPSSPRPVIEPIELARSLGSFKYLKHLRMSGIPFLEYSRDCDQEAFTKRLVVAFRTSLPELSMMSVGAIRRVAMIRTKLLSEGGGLDINVL